MHSETFSSRRTRRALRAGLVALVLLAQATPLLAQGVGKMEEAPTKSYVASYFIVMAATGVGLMVVLRGSKRQEAVPERRVAHDEEE